MNKALLLHVRFSFEADLCYRFHNPLHNRSVMNQRPIVPPTTHVTDAPTARRPIIPQTSGSAAKPAQIVPRRTDSSPSAPLVPRQTVARTTSKDPSFVLDAEVDEEVYLARSASVPRAKLGDQDAAREQLRRAAKSIEDDAHRRRAHETVIRSDSCYVSEKERYTRSRRDIRVEYTRKTKPQLLTAFSEMELQKPSPKIRYADGEHFGPNPFLELVDDTYGTPYTNDAGEEVEICFAGMSLYMERKEDTWVYWPHDRQNQPQNFPLRGKVTQSFFEARYFDPPTEPITHEEDVDGDQIALAFEVTPEEGDPYVLMIVTLLTGEKRAIKVPYDETFFA